jgi:hypothetical protein
MPAAGQNNADAAQDRAPGAESGRRCPASSSVTCVRWHVGGFKQFPYGFACNLVFKDQLASKVFLVDEVAVTAATGVFISKAELSRSTFFTSVPATKRNISNQILYINNRTARAQNHACQSFLAENIGIISVRQGRCERRAPEYRALGQRNSKSSHATVPTLLQPLGMPPSVGLR